MNFSNPVLKACRFLAPVVSCSTEYFSRAVHCVRSPYFLLVLSMSPDNSIYSSVGFVLRETVNSYSVCTISLTACALLASLWYPLGHFFSWLKSCNQGLLKSHWKLPHTFDQPCCPSLYCFHFYYVVFEM